MPNKEQLEKEIADLRINHANELFELQTQIEELKLLVKKGASAEKDVENNSEEKEVKVNETEQRDKKGDVEVKETATRRPEKLKNLSNY